jgi:hypothetical protein
MMVSTEIYTPSLTTVTPVRTSFGNILFTAEMGRTSSSLSRPAINLYIIYEV